MRRSIKTNREMQSRETLTLGGMVRRMILRVASATGFFEVEGHEGEVFTAESFPGVGIFARPKAGGGVDVIVLNVGGASEHPVIVALRDELAPALEPDETALYNSVARIVITKDGDIRLIAKAGRTVSVDDGSGAVPLVTREEFIHHTHQKAAETGTPTEPIAISGYTGGFNGTSVLKGK